MKKLPEDGDYISAGIFDSMLHTFLNTSSIPYNVIKILINL